jgi:hypothetical protein
MGGFFKQVIAKYTLVTSDFKTVEKKFLDLGAEKAKVKDYLDRFKKLRDRNKLKDDEKNIDLWGSKPFQEFQERIEELEKAKTRTEKKKGKVDLRENIPGAKLITENEEWTVFEITTNEASHKLGQGTEWCIKHDKSEQWDHYDRSNTIYFFISKTRDQKDPWSKLALLIDLQGKKTYWDRRNKAHKRVPTDLKLPRFKVIIPKFKWKADSSGDIDVSEEGLTSLEGAPQTVDRNFNCRDNKLTSLEGAPQTVGKDFYCSSNRLTSLEGAPQKVGGFFICNSNRLTSLEGSPQEVGGCFDCSDNKLTSLAGAPQKVDGYFSCRGNQLISLEGAPREVVASFDCSNNQLTSLEGAPQTVGGNFFAPETEKNSLRKKSVRSAKSAAKSMFSLRIWLTQARSYFINRFIDKTHALTSSSLKRGQFHELDTRILHCLFDSLVDYIEKELAWMHVICTEANPKRRGFGWRSRHEGLAHLDWESELMDDHGQPTSQALSAREIKALYLWWTEERPKRQDPFMVSSMERFFALERQFTNEDGEMLIRLMKIRSNLWT